VSWGVWLASSGGGCSAGDVSISRSSEGVVVAEETLECSESPSPPTVETDLSESGPREERLDLEVRSGQVRSAMNFHYAWTPYFNATCVE